MKIEKNIGNIENNNEKVNAIYSAITNSGIKDLETKLNNIIKSSSPNNIGANYYLTCYLSDFLQNQPSIDDYTAEEQSLENEFIKNIIPHLSQQVMSTEVRKKHDSRMIEPDYVGFPEYYKFMADASLSNTKIKNIVDKLAEISLMKIANKQPINEKDYGYIINKIALFIGDQFSYEYQLLYIGLFHELTQSHNYGETAEKYLNTLLRKKCVINDGLIGEGLTEDLTEDSTSMRKR